MPTRAAARAPNACENAIRCGIAVIGMKIASAAPIADPTSTAIAIHRMSTICAWISVPVTAAAIPSSPALIPLRAVVGWVSHFSARTNPTLAIR